MEIIFKRRFSITLSLLILFSLVYSSNKAQAVSAETLIKSDNNPAVYYLGSDLKRYVFPNETVFFSWYQNFEGVEVIKQSELSQYPLGGNITIRPGTYLAKITTDPAVYTIEPGGILKKIRNEAQARTLYGNDWNRRIVDIPDAFFSNYRISGELAEGQIPAGSLVRKANSNAIYYYDGASYRHINDMATLRSNRFQIEHTLSLAVNISSPGQSITGQERGLLAQIQHTNAIANQGGGGGNTSSNTGGNSGGNTGGNTGSNNNSPVNPGNQNIVSTSNASERLAHNQSFVIPSNVVNGDTVGQLTTFWKDLEKRSLAYSIVNDNGVFAIDNAGKISVKDASRISGSSINIRVKGTDQAANKAEEADMTIRVLPATNTIFIDPTASTNGNGTREKPFNTWAGVNIASNKNYLQKRGTEITLNSRINIGGNSNVVVGAYGSATARPKVKIYNLKGGTNAAVSMTGGNNTVRDLDIDAKLSTTGIYSGGGNNNTIDNVRILNSEWGLRTMNAATGFKFLNSEVGYIGDDGHYSQNHDNMEIAHNYYHHINQKWNENSYWYKGKSEKESPGDGIQLNGSILGFNIHHNIIDRTDTGNKFCVIIAPNTSNNSRGLLEYNHCTLRPGGKESGFYIAGNVVGAKIRHNTFVNLVGIYSHSRDMVISNNTFVNSRLVSQYKDDKLIFDNQFINQ